MESNHLCTVSNATIFLVYLNFTAQPCSKRHHVQTSPLQPCDPYPSCSHSLYQSQHFNVLSGLACIQSAQFRPLHDTFAKMMSMR